MATKRIVSRAKKAALKSSGCWKTGAVIFRGSTILSVGTNNMMRTSPKTHHPFYSIHAEVAALLKVRYKDRKGASIFVFRVGRDGFEHMAMPCASCDKILRENGITRMSWSQDTNIKVA